MGPRPGTRARRSRRTVDLLVVGLWLLTRVVLLVVSLNPRLYSAALFGDIRFYGAKVERMFQGELPYRDVATEYPPGSVPFTILPGLVVGTGGGYRLAFACEMLLVDAVGLWAATRLARVVDAGRRRIPLAYVLAMVAVGPLLVLRFDIVPAVCVLLAAAMAAEGRFGWAAAALGYGTAAKIFPGVLAPLLVLGLVPALGWWRSFARTVPPFLAGFGLTVVPALRPVGQGDGRLGAVPRAAGGADREPLGQPDRHRPPVRAARPDRLRLRRLRPRAPASPGSPRPSRGWPPLAALAGAAWLVWRRARARGGLGPADWAGAFTLGTFAFVLPTRVLSPQYLVWLCAPMVGLALVLAGRRALWTLVAAALVSQVVFPFRYTQLRRLYPFDIGLLTLRNLLLLVACALVIQAFNRPPAGPRGGCGQRRVTVGG